jgi:hypothetical protein
MYKIVLFMLMAALLLTAEDLPKEWLRVTKTDHADFSPEGAIRIIDAHGDLNIEGWERPEVEVSVTKSTLSLYGPKAMESARKRLDLISVTLDRKSANDLTISTAFPSRKLTRLARGKSDLILEYRIRVPRGVSLTVHDDFGAVLLMGVSGDVDAHIGVGDIVMMPAGGAAYSYDAKSGFGSVHTDYGGYVRDSGPIGRQYAFAPASPKHKAVLRVSIGHVNIE